MSVDNYKKQVEEALGVKLKGSRIALSYRFANPQEAKLQRQAIGQAQKRLRFIKKEITADVKRIRANYAAQTGKVQAGFGEKLLFGKGKAKSMAADQKRRMNQKRDQAIAPYQSLSLIIDNILTEMDGLKLQIDRYLQENK